MQHKASHPIETSLAIFALILLISSPANAQFTKIHNFNGDNGQGPEAVLTVDGAGNLYGTSSGGGAFGDLGTAFRLTPTARGSWRETFLYSFGAYQGDGTFPDSNLVFDASGNLYGTTYGGGTFGQGTVFELIPPAAEGSWQETILHNFDNNGSDGIVPSSGLVIDASGNLYGTTTSGGSSNNGTVFEVSPSVGGGWTETVLYSFLGVKDGATPMGVLTFDAIGNLYGTTQLGGAGCGTVFELTPIGGAWTETLLRAFNFNDGCDPGSGVIFDQLGNLYGTTSTGGHRGCDHNGCGIVFELSPAVGGGWTEKVLDDFTHGARAYFPVGNVAFDASGNLYVATTGPIGCCGAVVELTPNGTGGWTQKVLHDFHGPDGNTPQAGLASDAAGNIFGTTFYGGFYGVTGLCSDYGCGTVFEITPQGAGPL